MARVKIESLGRHRWLIQTAVRCGLLVAISNLHFTAARLISPFAAPLTLERALIDAGVCPDRRSSEVLDVARKLCDPKFFSAFYTDSAADRRALMTAADSEK
ncbi:hypothetical protein HDF16_001123 [Granulicella aggregans]|uniref:Uncharacterized protein n=1 Tax=Granulicella aggregans TaxID=474949 RepID=A0A7W7ZAR9_9BACT|nr:hypothetical protein [Granulicella aggregans]